MALAAMGGANNSSTNAMFPEAWLVTYEQHRALHLVGIQ